MTQLDEIRQRHTEREKSRKLASERPSYLKLSDGKHDDIGYLLDLVSEQQGKLNTCERLVQGWERTAPAMESLTGTGATLICAAELKGILNGD